ncbi:hypothetical protein GCM10017562_00010 [Streptomyces roseofulvus]|uniref:hypothetical protein n=1 Tax=Streptomyces roseofulvus TaxID=33902 RepID=UPI0031F98E31
MTGEHPTKLDADGLPAKTFETVSVPVPRVHATYAEGEESLLGALNKSASASSNGAGLQPLYLDAFVGDELRADVSDKTARPPVPQGSYGLGLDAYFQAEIIGQALARTTGLAQRFGYTPILQTKRPQWFLDTVAPWPRVRGVSREEMVKAEAYVRENPMPQPPEPARRVSAFLLGLARDASDWTGEGSRSA